MFPFPTEEKIVRSTYIINFLQLSENDDHFIFMGIQQIDMKVKIPQFVYTMTLPYGMRDWYVSLEGYLKEKFRSEEKIIQ